MGVDYAGAWHGDKGACFRMVVTSPTDGRPTRCPQLPIRVGWRKYGRQWLALDACADHYPQLEARPQP